MAAVEHAKAPKPAKDAFLEQAIVRRELSFNLTRHNPHYDSLKSLPAWALQTMREHEDDPHPELIDDEKIEAAETYDELWNAAQRELTQHRTLAQLRADALGKARNRVAAQL